jgi:hypothetical protein
MSMASRGLAALASSFLLVAIGASNVARAEPTTEKAPLKPVSTTPPPPPDASIRPPPFKDDIETTRPPSVRHIELGFSLLSISRPAAGEVEGGAPALITYSPTLGLQASLRIPIHRYFEAGAFITGGRHHIDFANGALGVNGKIDGSPLTTIWFGAKALPTLPIGDYVRLFGVVGFAWGRFEFPQMTAQEPGRPPFVIKGRGSSFVTFPLGVGSSFEVIRNWLAIDLELDVAPCVHKDGTSFVKVQTIDSGALRVIGPLPKAVVTYTQSLGVSLIL